MSRLSLVASGTADDAGGLVVTFDAPPRGSVFTGAVAVPNAPDDAALQVFIGSAAGLALGSFIGKQGFTGVQAYANERVVIAGSGFAPGVTYSASFVGSIDDELHAPPVSPASAPNPGGGKATVNFLNFVRDTFGLDVITYPVAVLAATEAWAMFVSDGGASLTTMLLSVNGPADSFPLFITDTAGMHA